METVWPNIGQGVVLSELVIQSAAKDPFACDRNGLSVLPCYPSVRCFNANDALTASRDDSIGA
jgi:hypothetical protein